MIKIRPEELVRYLFNETSEQETAAIKAALQTDMNLHETFEELFIDQRRPNEVKLSSRPQGSIKY
jgi:hypothetical protein